MSRRRWRRIFPFGRRNTPCRLGGRCHLPGRPWFSAGRAPRRVAFATCRRFDDIPICFALAGALLPPHLLTHLRNQIFSQSIVGATEGLPPIGQRLFNLAHGGAQP